MTPPAERAAPKSGDVLLLARETEQLQRIADRLRARRRVVAFLACDIELRPQVATWLSEASGREVKSPELGDAVQLLHGMMALSKSEEVESLGWEPGRKEPLETLNLNREKLRTGGGALVWCTLGELDSVRTLARDAFSFRDTLVIVEGFRIPEIHVPEGDTPELRLARMRYELPGTPFEKALSAAETARLLLEQRRAVEAFMLAQEAILPFLEGQHDPATGGALTYLKAVMTAALAMSGHSATAFELGRATLFDLVEQGVDLEEIRLFSELQHPTSQRPVDSAFALLSYAADGPPEELALSMARVSASMVAHTGDHRTIRTIVHDALEQASVADGRDEASILLSASTGDLHSAESMANALLRDSRGTTRDLLSVAVVLGDVLLHQGELGATHALTSSLRATLRGTDLALNNLLSTARAVTLAGKPRMASSTLRRQLADWTPDGTRFRLLSSLVAIAATAKAAGRARTQDLVELDDLLRESQSLFPGRTENTPPFYDILVPGLRAIVLSRVAERREDAVELARKAYDSARAEYPNFTTRQAHTLVNCLFRAKSFDLAYETIVPAEQLAQETDYFRDNATFKGLRLVLQAIRGDSRAVMEVTFRSLRETLETAGSALLSAETELMIARNVPKHCTYPEPLTLVDEAMDRFAEMPMPASEELCREARGDILLARGEAREAVECFAAAAKRLRHYGILLRVPLLERKRAVAEARSS
ncbi:MAG: hypothetical protein U0441_06550 [Polyangiaceae bacterium]